MSQKQREIQVGLAVIVSAIALTAGTLWFQHHDFGDRRRLVLVDFAGVDGLKTQDRVQVRGIRMGLVESFAIVGEKVRVTLEMAPEADLRQDAHFRLMTVGIVGEMVIEVDPGRGAPAPDGHVFTGETILSIAGMTDLVAQTLHTVAEVSGDLKAVLASLAKEDRIGGTLDETRTAAAALGEVLADNRRGLREVVDNLAATTGVLRASLAGPDSAAAGLADDVRGAVARTDSLLGRLGDSADSLERILAGLEAGEGTAGRLLQDDRLYVMADSTLTTLNRLLREVKRNPKRYLAFEVF